MAKDKYDKVMSITAPGLWHYSVGQIIKETESHKIVMIIREWGGGGVFFRIWVCHIETEPGQERHYAELWREIHPQSEAVFVDFQLRGLYFAQ